METIKILIADDYSIMREGIKQVLEPHKELEIVADTNTGQDAIEYLRKNRNSVDVLLLDINKVDCCGTAATKTIMEENDDVKILALTLDVDNHCITEIIKAGAMGCILKNADIKEFVLAIKTVAMCDNYYSNEVSIKVIHGLMNDKQAVNPLLSGREIEILEKVADGGTNKEVALELSISGRTVETHRRNILGKLGVRNTAEMIRYAFEHKLIA